jgi:uncharacterized protein YndB with AHSA1/START domain
MDLGTLEPDGTRWRLRFTRTLPHPPEKVWRALTTEPHLSAWFPSRIEGEWTPGAPLQFVFDDGEAPDMKGEVRAVEPPRVLEFTWGDDLLRFELEAIDGGTVLRMSDTFDELGRAARDAAGWHECLDILAAALDGREPAPGPWRVRWQQYIDAFGPEAGAMGPPDGHPEA